MTPGELPIAARTSVLGAVVSSFRGPHRSHEEVLA